MWSPHSNWRTTWELVRNAESQAHPNLLNQILYLNKTPRWLECTLKTEKHWSRNRDIDSDWYFSSVSQVGITTRPMPPWLNQKLGEWWWEPHLALVRMLFFLTGCLLTPEKFRIKYRNDGINQSHSINIFVLRLQLICTDLIL